MGQINQGLMFIGNIGFQLGLMNMEIKKTANFNIDKYGYEITKKRP